MRNKKRRVFDNRGFTLIEIMVVVVIIAIMASVITPNYFNYMNKANVTKVTTDMKSFSTALGNYYLDNNMYPTTEQGLKALIEQPTSDPAPLLWQSYLNIKEIPNDPWSTPYIYRSPGDNGEEFVIISLGKNRREGGEGYDADIRSSDLR